jgi:hypothetical protein
MKVKSAAACACISVQPVLNQTVTQTLEVGGGHQSAYPARTQTVLKRFTASGLAFDSLLDFVYRQIVDCKISWSDAAWFLLSS